MKKLLLLLLLSLSLIGSAYAIPKNAYATSSTPEGWKCKFGYKIGNTCTNKLPAHAYATPASEYGWKCKYGYRKSGDTCVKKDGSTNINIPPNAYAYGSGWKCNFGYEKSGNSCQKELSEIYIDGDKYVGELRNGKPHGKGTLTTPDGEKYVGEFENGLPHGHGTFTSTEGFKYVGGWNKGEMHGQATCTIKYEGELIVINGEFKNNAPYGSMTVTHSGGRTIIGEFNRDFLPIGAVTVIYPNGNVYIGGWGSGNKEGQGTMTYANGTTKEGVWKDDNFLYATNESTPKNNYSNDEELLPAASGTGFAVTSDGYVVTNNHVVKDCNNVEIYHKGRVIPSVVVNVDPVIDLAIIKGNFRPENFYYLSTKRPRLRMSVDVIGYGFGKKISSNVKTTRGIISSLVGIENDSSRFQIDAAVQPGNSGGPIIDSDEKSPTYGNVIGVAVEKVNVDWAKKNLSRVPENIAFGIKSGAVINFLDGNNIEYSIDKKLSDDEIDKLIHGGTYYLSCLMTLSQYEKVKKTRVLFSDLE